VLALLGALFAAIYVLVGRDLRARISVVTYTSIVYSVSAAVLAAMMIASGTPFFGYPPETWMIFALITAGPQFLGHTVFNYLLEHVKASVVAVALLAEPVGATLLAYLFLDEVPTTVTVVGGAIVLVGVWMAIRAEAATVPDVLEPVE
jgi:drug/metabolite transporter (DMT)-like permease